MDPKDATLPKTVSITHTCRGAARQPVELHLASDGMYRGTCERCRFTFEADRTTSRTAVAHGG